MRSSEWRWVLCNVLWCVVLFRVSFCFSSCCLSLVLFYFFFHSSWRSLFSFFLFLSLYCFSLFLFLSPLHTGSSWWWTTTKHCCASDLMHHRMERLVRDLLLLSSVALVHLPTIQTWAAAPTERNFFFRTCRGKKELPQLLPHSMNAPAHPFKPSRKLLVLTTERSGASSTPLSVQKRLLLRKRWWTTTKHRCEWLLKGRY